MPFGSGYLALDWTTVLPASGVAKAAVSEFFVGPRLLLLLLGQETSREEGKKAKKNVGKGGFLVAAPLERMAGQGPGPSGPRSFSSLCACARVCQECPMPAPTIDPQQKNTLTTHKTERLGALHHASHGTRNVLQRSALCCLPLPPHM